jgi:HPt (histidine-containing phosphotransfer) domain-containing protein
MSNQPHRRAIDHTFIDEYRSLSDDAFVASLIERYLAESAVQIAAINTAISAAQLDRISATAHALKGASSTIGAASLAAICGEIEILARTSTLDAVRGAGATAATEYECVRQELLTLSRTGVVAP